MKLPCYIETAGDRQRDAITFGEDNSAYAYAPAIIDIPDSYKPEIAEDVVGYTRLYFGAAISIINTADPYMPPRRLQTDENGNALVHLDTSKGSSWQRWKVTRIDVTKTRKMYVSYGALSHEKQPIYTMDAPATDNYDVYDLTLPDGWSFADNALGETLIDSSDGKTYLPEEILTNHGDAPALQWYDGQSYHWIDLSKCATLRRL